MSNLGADFELLGRNNTQSVKELMSGLFTSETTKKLSANQKASYIWRRANGDIERAHTTGVFLKESSNKNLEPVLVVYVDSHARISDFSANKELYLIRLRAYGLSVSGIEFWLTKKPRPKKVSAQKPAPQKQFQDLTKEQVAYIEEITSDLPDSLKAAAQKAIKLSFQNNGTEGSKNKEAGK